MEIDKKKIKDLIKKARADVDISPTQPQCFAGNYSMGHVSFLGYQITIENPKGSIRRGTDADGNSWRQKMHNDYGYFTHTLGKDGDAIDVFLGDDFDSDFVFGIDQRYKGNFDETKIMLGFKTSQEAKEAYLSNYNDNWKGFWRITKVTHEQFKIWLYDGYKQRKPFSEYQEFKKKK